ncbi:hypothetical protein KR009_002032 [Drosophila setifemur]|nr:hypothetical protein KR009_002032 [Drosophila setifemur]
MQLSTFLLSILVVALLVLFTAPTTEATFFLIACLLRSPFCPFTTANSTSSG